MFKAPGGKGGKKGKEKVVLQHTGGTKGGEKKRSVLKCNSARIKAEGKERTKGVWTRTENNVNPRRWQRTKNAMGSY